MPLRRRRRRRELQAAPAPETTLAGRGAPEAPERSVVPVVNVSVQDHANKGAPAAFAFPKLTKNQWLAAGAIALALSAIAALSFAPIVRAVAVAHARRMGIELDIRSVRPGFGVVRLRDVRATLVNVPAVRAQLDCIEINPTMFFGVEAVAVHGGRVALSGSLDDLERQISALRKGRLSTETTARDQGAAIEVDGVDLVWKELHGGTRIWGAQYARTPSGDEHAGADLVRLNRDGSGIEAQGASLTLRRDHGRRVLSSFAAMRVVADVDLDELPIGALVPSPPAISDAVQARPKSHAGKKLRSALSRFADAAKNLLVPGASVDISGVRARLRHEAQILNIGPGALSVSRDDRRVRVQLTPGASREAPLTLALDVPLADGPVIADLDGGPVSLAALGVHEGDMGLVEVAESYLEGRGRAELAADGESLEFSGRSRVTGLSVQDARLAPDPVRGLSVGASGEGSLALDGSRIDLKETEVSLGKVRVQISGHIERGDGDAAGRLQLKVPLASCEEMFESIPEGLVPLLRGMRWSGTFALGSQLKFDTRRAADIDVDWQVANECRITDVPESIHPARFQRPWMRTVEGPGGDLLSIESGPGTPDWTPYFDISRHVETALIVCEDAHFWAHDGFDHEAIRDSIRDNVLARRFVRGASTLSMQLAKNLYLGREKTLSRKFQEAVLTMLLEQQLSKEEILELYLNVVEFGPGIFGIGPAAQYYFHSRARDLTIGQALYLASILPNPNQSHFGQDGHLSERWATYLHRLMGIAHKIRRLSDDELQQGLSESVAFGVSSVSDAGEADASERPNPSIFELAP